MGAALGGGGGLGDKGAFGVASRTFGVMVKSIEREDWRVGVQDLLGYTGELRMEEEEEERKEEEEGKGGFEILKDTRTESVEGMVAKAAVTVGCFMAGGDRGTWCLTKGWSDGNGVDEVCEMMEGGKGMWAGAEVMVNAVNWDEGRTVFKEFIEKGGLQKVAGNTETRTQGVVAFAKLGMASKGMEGEEGEEVRIYEAEHYTAVLT